MHFTLLLVTPLFFISAFTQSDWQIQPIPLKTRWASDVSPANALPEYPRPQLVRSQWQNLNGLWDFAITPKDAPPPQAYKGGKILVPYPLESALSGVKRSLQPDQHLWYKRTFQKPSLKKGERVFLHFGAVDYEAKVYVNRTKVGKHTGGYQEFSFDITSSLKSGTNELVVQVWDPSDRGNNPRGKQSLQPQGIMYTATSGIWQTVWFEIVPEASIAALRLTPDVDAAALRAMVNLNTQLDGYNVRLTASSENRRIASVTGKPSEEINLPVPKPRLWSPNDPFLYDLSVELIKQGQVIDRVTSYFGMRKIEIRKDAEGIYRIFLNNEYIYNLGVLDQGFWPDGLHTAPTDAALRFDIEAIKSMGFNTIRKHIKREPARWYYHADKVGILVWQDMMQPANITKEGKEQFEKEIAANIEQLHNYPSIICWVLFNEGWNRYDQQRLTQWIKQLDPSRLINGHSGENYDRGSPQNPADKWIRSDLTDVHEYPGPGIASALLGKARALGEWGGVGVSIKGHQWNPESGWGYIKVLPSEFARKYYFMHKHLKLYEEEGQSASIYTQPFDVEIEENGLMTYDREVIKIPIERLREIHAVLVPPTGPVAKSFTAKNADMTNPDQDYPKLLQEYQNGKRDPSFIRELALMAVRANDKANSAKIADDYIGMLKSPFNKEQLSFVDQFINSTKDKGFALFLNNREEVNRLLGQRHAELKLMGIIYREEIEPFVTDGNPHPDWKMPEAKIRKYASVGEEILLRAKTIHYLNYKDWKNFTPTATTYIERFGTTLSAGDLNHFAWTVFENVDDPNRLNAALGWSELSNKQLEHPALMDTYANLLYKLGRRDEAVNWQERAIQLAAENEKKNYQGTLEKMKKGDPTWSTAK